MRLVNLCACLTITGQFLEPQSASALVAPSTLGLRSRSYHVLRADNADSAANDGGDPAAEAARLKEFREKLMRQMGGSTEGAGGTSSSTDEPMSDRQKAKSDARAARRARDAEAGINLDVNLDGPPPPSSSSSPPSETGDSAASEPPKAPPNFSLAGLGGLTGKPEEPEPWAKPLEWDPSAGVPLPVGTVLFGNPEVFCDPNCPKALLEQMLLSSPLPLKDLGPMQCANVMPVVIVVEEAAKGATATAAANTNKGGFFGTGIGASATDASASTEGGAKGLMLNRRTGYLMADLKMDVAGFMIQPLQVGGRENASQGITMLHPYAEVKGALPVTDAESDAGGLFYGGEFQDAQALVKRGTGTQFKFKFFVQATKWAPGALEQQVADGVWKPCRVSKEVLLKIRERDGPRGLPPKPLWTEAMELCGGEYAAQAEAFLNSNGGGDELAPSGFAEDP